MRLMLIHHGENKIRCIKVLRNYEGIGLKEAKSLSEDAPVEVGLTLAPGRKRAFHADLRDVGSTVSLEAGQERVRLTLTTSKPVLALIQQLHDTGLYGRTPTNTAEEILRRAVLKESEPA